MKPKDENESDDLFTGWAQGLPKPVPGEAACKSSLDAAMTELKRVDRRHRSLRFHAIGMAACWILIGLVQLGAPDREPLPQSTTRATRLMPPEGSDSAQLLAQLYAAKSQPFFPRF